MRILYTLLLVFISTVSFAQDVIVKKTGEMINGKVLEVGVDYLKYRRGDQTSGPIYTIPLKYVYGISYADRTQDIFTVPDSTILKEYLDQEDTSSFNMSLGEFAWDSGSSEFSLGMGMFRKYTKVKSSGKNSASIPVIFGSYAIEMKNSLLLGFELMYSSYKNTGSVKDQYGKSISNYTIKENITSLNVYLKKKIGIGTAFFPYVKAGLGLNSSRVKLKTSLGLDSRRRKNLDIESAGSATGLNVIARVGTEYHFNQKTGAFLDVGMGHSLIQFGVISVLNSSLKKKKSKIEKEMEESAKEME